METLIACIILSSPFWLIGLSLCLVPDNRTPRQKKIDALVARYGADEIARAMRALPDYYR